MNTDAGADVDGLGLLWGAVRARFACHPPLADHPAVASALQASLLRSVHLGLK